MASELHQERLDTVVQALLDSGARRVLDLGCGPGELLLRLARETQFTQIVGIDIDQVVLHEARELLGLGLPLPGDRIQVRQGSFAMLDAALAGFDAAALVETIEHLDPRLLGQMERAVFAGMRPGVVLVTTPNQEYNVVHGMAPGERRHPGHRFEWNRARFRQWAQGVAERNAYAVR
ncbi:MAG: methyltransferase type 12, partial [Gammaproteobacteria bacterium HGW-Gammaproteobacteria-7]